MAAAASVSDSPETVLPEKIGGEEEDEAGVEIQEHKTIKKKKKRCNFVRRKRERMIEKN